MLRAVEDFERGLASSDPWWDDGWQVEDMRAVAMHYRSQLLDAEPVAWRLEWRGRDDPEEAGWEYEETVDMESEAMRWLDRAPEDVEARVIPLVPMYRP